MNRAALMVLLMLAAGVWMGQPGPAHAESPTCSTAEVAGHPYKVCVPSSYTAGTPVPLVMMLHGCSQTNVEFERDTYMTEHAEARGFIALYPEQPATSNASKCWNWFLPEHQARGAGEPALLVAMADAVAADYDVACGQRYVAGLSAGAAMAVILGATYPEQFAAIGVSAGLEYKAGTDLATALLAQQLGGPDPDTQGQLAHEEQGVWARQIPTIVFHGTLDNTVNPINAEQVIAQWAQSNDLADNGSDDDSFDATPDESEQGTVPGGRTFTRERYYDAGGAPLLEQIMVEGMTHRWSGGAPEGTYTDPQGPDSSTRMLDFFFANPDTTACTPTATTLDTVGVTGASGNVWTGALLLAGVALLGWCRRYRRKREGERDAQR